MSELQTLRLPTGSRFAYHVLLKHVRRTAKAHESEKQTQQLDITHSYIARLK